MNLWREADTKPDNLFSRESKPDNLFPRELKPDVISEPEHLYTPNNTGSGTNDLTVEDIMDEFFPLVVQTADEDAEMFTDDDYLLRVFERSMKLKGGIERKWKLMFSPEVASFPDLKRKAMATFSGRFVDDSFIWELRSQTDLVPFSAIVAGDLETIPIPCLDLESAVTTWECVRLYAPFGRVAIIGDKATTAQVTVEVQDVVSGSSIKIENRQLEDMQVCETCATRVYMMTTLVLETVRRCVNDSRSG